MSESINLSDFKSESDLSGYDYPEKGQYHLAVTEVDASRSKDKAIFVSFVVVAGNPAGQENKVFRERFGDPAASHKDGGKFAVKRQAKLLLATGILKPDDLGKEVNINWADLFERQLKASVVTYERKDGDKTFRGAQIDGLSMWGPCDTDAEHIPSNEDCLNVARRMRQSNVPQVGGILRSSYSNV